MCKPGPHSYSGNDVGGNGSSAEEEMTVIREVFASDSVEPLTMDEHGNITYLVQSEIIPDAEITISETEDGGTRFFVVEGELENELVFFFGW